ncbi:restriction endonuclease subunit S [Metabacillus sp. KIGAM252]|uniref:Restriction endonuclease subunit S n=1 Tax=Metabacillus flavus TaxID=2823519 RepID=A0ABS5LIF8_9BACI|nr:restriction endonuclease subunit S [Metabacillus flavus]MBS2970540.1 restriction endonuclease subunit S [Metabacillus flavus]
MKNIKKYAFSDLYDMSSGISTKKEQAGHGSPFVSFSTVFNNYFLPDVLPDLMNTTEKEQNTYSIKEGDILVTRTSETINELAMSCVALKDYPTATYSGFTKRLRPKTEGIVYYKYLAFYLRSYLFRKTVTNNAFITTRASFNEDIFSFLNLYLPDYDEQVRIGDLLYSMEKKIRLNKRIIAELEQMAKTIYDYWFVQFDFPNVEGKPYHSSGGEMVWNSRLKREIPKDWEDSLISNEFITLLGGTPDTKVSKYWNGNIPWLSSGEIATSPIIKSEKSITESGINNSTTSFVKAGAVLLSITRYIRPSILEIDACFNQSVVAIIPTSKFKTAFLYPFMLSQVNRYMSLRTGAQQPHINKTVVDETIFVVPDEQTLEKYYDLVEPIYNKITSIAKEIDELTNFREWLLPMLMNGQVTLNSCLVPSL